MTKKITLFILIGIFFFSFISVQSQISWSVNEPNPEIVSWIILENIQELQITPKLLITEVYYDGTDERIEITNQGSSFSGQIILLFPKEVVTYIDIKEGESVIIAKPSITYSWISPLVTKIFSPTFSITDTKAIDIFLYRNNQELDHFFVETGIVLAFDNKKISFNKKYNQIWTIIPSTVSFNVEFPYIANPGIWEGQISNITWSINTGTIYSWSGTTWADTGGESLSGIVDTPTPTSPQPPSLSITEIYQTNWQFSSFIEIKANQDLNERFLFTWSLLKTSFELDINLKNQEYMIIVQSDNWWLSNQKKLENTSLNLNNSWFLMISRQSGQGIDTITISSMLSWKSNYNSNISTWNIRIFSKIDSFSPWFDESFLFYVDHNTPCTTSWNDTIIQNTPQIDSWSMSTIENQTWQNLSWETLSWENQTWLFVSKDLLITSIEYLSPESITISSNIGFSLDLSQKERYLLTKETVTWSWKTTKKYLTGIVLSWESITINKTRWFLDKGSCVGLFYQTIQLDEKCYWSTLQTWENEEILEEPKEESDDKLPNIKILWVLPNPKGKDDQEQLHILRTPYSWETSFNIPDKSLYLKINTTKKYLTGQLLAHTGIIFIWSLWLVNKAACIEIWYKTNILDTFCYSNPEENEFLDKNGHKPPKEQIPNIKILWVLPNPKGKDDQEQLHIFRTPYSWETSFPILDNTLYLLHNTSKKYLTWLLQPNITTIITWSLGFINKAHCFSLMYKTTLLDTFCYTNPKDDEYFSTWNTILQTIQKSDFSILQKVWFTITWSQICVSYYNQFLSCRLLPASKTSIKLKNENKLYKSYFAVFQDYLIKNRSTLYYNTDIKTYFDTFKQAKNQLIKHNSLLLINNQKIDIYDLSWQIQLTKKVQWLSWSHTQENSSWRQNFLQWLGL